MCAHPPLLGDSAQPALSRNHSCLEVTQEHQGRNPGTESIVVHARSAFLSSPAPQAARKCVREQEALLCAEQSSAAAVDHELSAVRQRVGEMKSERSTAAVTNQAVEVRGKS